jgi:hypothetical protein
VLCCWLGPYKAPRGRSPLLSRRLVVVPRGYGFALITLSGFEPARGEAPIEAAGWDGVKELDLC